MSSLEATSADGDRPPAHLIEGRRLQARRSGWKMLGTILRRAIKRTTS